MPDLAGTVHCLACKVAHHAGMIEQRDRNDWHHEAQGSRAAVQGRGA
jgi:hypothetical protein